MPNKRGPVTKQEGQFIKDNYKTLSPAEIAKQLQRTEPTIRQWMMENLKVAPDGGNVTQERVDQLAIQKELQNSPEWEALRAEFTDDERKFFKHRYSKLMLQFGDDVLATEETQVFNLIKYEILLHRNLSDTKRSVDEIERMEKILEDTYDSYPNAASMDDATKSFVTNLENQLVSARVAKQAMTGEYNKLSQQTAAIMKDLKATRDQRFDRYENNKESLLDVIKDLQREEMQERQGRQEELVRLAVERERGRLSQLHTYADGGVDQPLLTPESIVAVEEATYTGNRVARDDDE